MKIITLPGVILITLTVLLIEFFVGWHSLPTGLKYFLVVLDVLCFVLYIFEVVFRKFFSNIDAEKLDEESRREYDTFLTKQEMLKSFTIWGSIKRKHWVNGIWFSLALLISTQLIGNLMLGLSMFGNTSNAADFIYGMLVISSISIWLYSYYGLYKHDQYHKKNEKEK